METCKAIPITALTWKGGENSTAIVACPSHNLPVRQEGNLYVKLSEKREGNDPDPCHEPAGKNINSPTQAPFACACTLKACCRALGDYGKEKTGLEENRGAKVTFTMKTLMLQVFICLNKESKFNTPVRGDKDHMGTDKKPPLPGPLRSRHLFQPEDPKSQGSLPHHQDEIKHRLCASSITRESLGEEANDKFSRINGRGRERGNFRQAESNELEFGQDTEVLVLSSREKCSGIFNNRLIQASTLPLIPKRFQH
ncbi:hypothetical protein BTVI_09377 [Pitangus sulphuratus]|nr:hypothetical protein BTVI_09377 [Pitangus sulphuratus]